MTYPALGTEEAYAFAVSYGRKWNRRMGEMLDPDEVTGIAGETVARHLPDYDPDRYPNCYAWLARKVHYACVDQVRRERGRDRSSEVRPGSGAYQDRLYRGTDRRRTIEPVDPYELAGHTGSDYGTMPGLSCDDDTGEVDLVLDARQFLDEIPRQQREIVEARMAGAQGAEIGERWGVSATRISQIMRDVRSRYHSWAGAGA